MDDDETEILTLYVWRNCQHLLTDLEWRADRAGMAEIKAAAAEERGSMAMARILRERWGALDDPEVRAALADGYDAFHRRVVDRLLAEPEVRRMINRCPRCDRVVRTPQARQCLWCQHVWRDQKS